jgi:hypothetical protein
LISRAAVIKVLLYGRRLFHLYPWAEGRVTNPVMRSPHLLPGLNHRMTGFPRRRYFQAGDSPVHGGSTRAGAARSKGTRMNSQRLSTLRRAGPAGGEKSPHRPAWPRYMIFMMWLVLPAAHADPWRQEDTWRELSFQALYVYDLQQNLTALRNWQHRKKTTLSPSVAHNVFLGSDADEEAINGYFIVTGLLHWSVSAMLPAEAREHWQWLSMGYIVSDVVDNFRLGIRLTF